MFLMGMRTPHDLMKHLAEQFFRIKHGCHQWLNRLEGACPRWWQVVDEKNYTNLCGKGQSLSGMARVPLSAR